MIIYHRDIRCILEFNCEVITDDYKLHFDNIQLYCFWCMVECTYMYHWSHALIEIAQHNVTAMTSHYIESALRYRQALSVALLPSKVDITTALYTPWAVKLHINTSGFVSLNTCAMADNDGTHPEKCSALRKGGYVIIKDHPCKIVETSTSKPGKHGHAKVRIKFVSLKIF